MAWTGGYLRGTGATNIAAGATLTLSDGPDYLRQEGRPINNASTATWTTGGGNYWYLSDGAVFTNQAGATFNAQADDRIGVGGSNNRFNNLGPFMRSGAGTSLIQPTFNNSSPTQVTEGVLQLTGGGSSVGDMTVTTGGAALQFGGGAFTLGPASSITGDGDVTFSGAAATFAGSYAIPGVTTVSGGTVSFPNTSSVALGTVAQIDGNLYLGNATVSRNFARSGGFFGHSGLLTFNGVDIQGLTLNAATTFDRLTVNSGVILNETVAGANATVTGQRTNLGVIPRLASRGALARPLSLTVSTI